VGSLPEKLAHMALSELILDGTTTLKLGQVPIIQFPTNSNFVAWGFGHQVLMD
jgi:hypothetical protein